MASMLAYLKMVLIVQLFYSIAVTSIVYTLPADVTGVVDPFQAPSEKFSEKHIAESVGNAVGSETNLASIDMQSLMYYSGNIAIDLIANFATAVPQMVTILIDGLLRFFAVNADVVVQLRTFFYMLIMIAYAIGILSFLLGARAQGAIV
jgi:hypothetical protein